jgi:acetyl-CoA synthetase
VGPGEIEEALLEHPSVSEAAVIGVPDQIKGEAIVGFVVLKEPSTPELLLDAAAKVAEVMGPMFRPQALFPVRELPQTQSGKIVRRLIRQKYLGEPLGDLSTVQNPGALDEISPRQTTDAFVEG